MKYQSMMFVGALALSGVAVAGNNDKDPVSKDEIADFHVQCFEAAMGEELKDDQKDIYIKDCVQQQIAKRKSQQKNT